MLNLIFLMIIHLLTCFGGGFVVVGRILFCVEFGTNVFCPWLVEVLLKLLFVVEPVLKNCLLWLVFCS